MRGQYGLLDLSSFNDNPSSERTVAICKKVRPPSPIEVLVINIYDVIYSTVSLLAM